MRLQSLVYSFFSIIFEVLNSFSIVGCKMSCNVWCMFPAGHSRVWVAVTDRSSTTAGQSGRTDGKYSPCALSVHQVLDSAGLRICSERSLLLLTPAWLTVNHHWEKLHSGQWGFQPA